MLQFSQKNQVLNIMMMIYKENLPFMATPLIPKYFHRDAIFILFNIPTRSKRFFW
jgi:hypothetical protein